MKRMEASDGLACKMLDFRSLNPSFLAKSCVSSLRNQPGLVSYTRIAEANLETPGCPPAWVRPEASR